MSLSNRFGFAARPPEELNRLLLKAESPSVVTALLQSGANIDHKDEQGRTPLVTALVDGRENVAIALLKAGASTQMADNNGLDALYAAIELGRPLFIGAALHHGVAFAQEHRDLARGYAASHGGARKDISTALNAAATPPRRQPEKGLTK